MRTIKQLLQIMLEHKELFYLGLCSWKYELKVMDYISTEEQDLLEEYIKKNRPGKYSSLSAYVYRKQDYFWKPKDIAPRIKWIKKHINKL